MDRRHHTTSTGTSLVTTMFGALLGKKKPSHDSREKHVFAQYASLFISEQTIPDVTRWRNSFMVGNTYVNFTTSNA